MSYSKLHSYLATDIESRILTSYFAAPKKNGLGSKPFFVQENIRKPTWMTKGYSMGAGSPGGKAGLPGHQAPRL